MKERERRSAGRTCRRVTVRMEETPEARTVALKGAEEEAMVAAEVERVLWREAESAAGAADGCRRAGPRPAAAGAVAVEAPPCSARGTR